MPVHRVLQCLDGRFPIFHLNFEFRHNAVKFPLCNPSCALLVRQVIRHAIVEPARIRDYDIDNPLQIVEEADKALPAPSIIRLYISTLRPVYNNKASMFPVRNTD